MLDETVSPPGGRVELVARCVPAGWLDGKAKLTLALGLRAAPEGTGAPFATLPSAIFAALTTSTLRLEVKPVLGLPVAGIPAPLDATSIQIAPNATTLVPWGERTAAGRAEEIDRLWQHVMPERPGQDFSDLYNALKDYGSNLEAPDSADDVLPTKAVPDASGQIALACQIERALVERMAIQNRPGWQKQVIQAAVAAADTFLNEHGAKLRAGIPRRDEPESTWPRTSIDIAILREKAAAEITTASADAVTALSQSLGQALCDGGDAAKCRRLLRGGPADRNTTAGMLTETFKQILGTLLFLNQVNIRAAAMGQAEAETINDAATEGKEVEAEDMPKPQGVSRKLELLLARLKELETNSEFGRLFGLTHDFELSTASVDAISRAATASDPLGIDARYVMLRITGITAEAQALLPIACSHWTYAKLHNGDARRAPAFVPVSRHEVMVVLAAGGTPQEQDCEVLPELDGVRLLSAHADGAHPAYELSSIDPRDAMQDLDTRMSVLLTHVIEARDESTPIDIEKVADEFAATRPADQPWPLATLKSRSLRLYHFHRQSCCDSELGRTRALSRRTCNEMALDSEDLTIGWMYDGAARCLGDRSQQTWHPTSAALVSYEDLRTGGVRDLDELVSGFFRGDERARYQRASWAVAQQVKQEQGIESAEGGPGSRVVVADELVYEYNGEQQGTDNAVGKRTSQTGPYVENIPRSGLLDIGRDYLDMSALPEGFRSLELVNGIGYYLAARALHIGGGSVPDEVAHKVFDSVACAPVPRLTGELHRPGHRLVRTEKIARPLVLLNGEAASNQPGSYTEKYLPNSSRDVVLRSKLRGSDYVREGRYDTEKLIIVPGTVDLGLAHRHSVFTDDVPDITVAGRRRPRDGLPRLLMDAQSGGWATLDEVYAADGKVLINRQINASAQSTTANGSRAPSSAIFLRGGLPETRKHPYYPDPLHAGTVLRLRLSGTHHDWVGKALSLPRTDSAYPAVTPVSLTITRVGRDAPLRMRWQSGAMAVVAGTRCHDVRIDLPAGVSVELVAWPLPDLADFALSTEVVTLQTMISMSADAARSCIDGLPEAEGTVDALTGCLEAAGLLAPMPGTETCGIACGPAPGIVQLKATATYLHDLMKQRPLDVVCGHTVVSLTHAVDRPAVVPVPARLLEPPFENPDLVPAEVANQDLFARRTVPSAASPDAYPGLVAEVSRLPDDFVDEGPPGLSVSRGGTDIDLAGFLEVDALTTIAVEIDAFSESPLKAQIDDHLRTRGAENVREGVFPSRQISNPDAERLRAHEIYGFDVRLDASVAAPRQVVRLARFDGLPVTAMSRQALSEIDLGIAGWRPQRAFLALHRLFSLDSNSDGEATMKSEDGIVVDVGPVLAFTPSRCLGLRFRAIGRFTRLMTPRKTRVDDMPALPDVTAEWEDKQRTIRLPLPASRRPDPPVGAVKAHAVPRPDRREIGPEGQIILTRNGRIRLAFDRPLLSSGPLERIGIVLSPRPSTFGRDGRYGREFDGLRPTQTNAHRLRERFPDPKDLPPDLADRLTQFADKGTRPPLVPHPDTLEIGPYGLFPLPLPIFADARFDRLGHWLGANRPDVGYVADAQLPIYSDVEHNLEATRPDVYFPVDLLTYVPRFDMALEHWYIDVTLDPRGTLDPHLQLGVVRYQPLAPPDLQVSPLGDPFRCTLLPQRSTTIRYRQEGDEVVLEIVTAGPAATADTDGRDVGPRSRFSARLTGLERHGSSIVHRHLDETHPMKPGAANTFTAMFRIRREVSERLQLRIEVEEREERLRATQPNEPVLDASDQVSILSGPHYRTSIDLTEFVREMFR